MAFYQLVATSPPGQARVYPVASALVTIGRAPANDVVVNEQAVSRFHARLHRVAGGFEIEDVGSTNGTWLKGQKVKRTLLPIGQTVTLGNSTLRLREAAAPAPEEPAPSTAAELRAVLASSALEIELADLSLPRLVIHTAVRTWGATLTAEATTIGRASDCDIVVPDQSVSPQHVRISREGDAFVLRDLGGSGGTWLGERRVEKHKLGPGESFRIGSTLIVYNAALSKQGLAALLEGSLIRRGRPSRPIVFVPGFMGSELYLGSERIWPNVTAMLTNPELYRWPSKEPIEARRLVSEIVILPRFFKLERYAALGDFLCEELGYERGKDLLEFPWDWRQDLRVSAQRLAGQIAGWRERVKEARAPVTVIAHSIGCLVSRYYVEKFGGKSVVGRLMLMGGTHHGMPKTLQPFGAFGKQPFLYGVAEPFERAIASLPSLYTMLPTYRSVFDSKGRPIDLYEDESWCPEEFRPRLRDALAFRRELGTQSSVSTICIFGYGMPTPTRATFENRDSTGAWERMRLTEESRGDNTVPEESARLPNAEIHPVRQHHGSLYADNDVKTRLHLELAR